MATNKTVTKTAASWTIADQEAMGRELGTAYTVGLDAGQTFDDLVAKAHKLSKGIIGTVRSKCPVMLAVNEVLKAYRFKKVDPKTNKVKMVPFSANSLKTNLSYIRKAIEMNAPVKKGNGSKVNTIIFALGQKAKPDAIVDSLLKGFNKMKLNESNPFMQTLAMFLIDGVADAIKEAKLPKSKY